MSRRTGFEICRRRPLVTRVDRSDPPTKRRAKIVAILIAGLASMAGLVVPASASSTILPAEADAFVLSDSPNSNRGRNSTLRIRGESKVSYLRFDVPSLPPGETVVRATLGVFANSGSKCAAGAEILRAASDTW